MSIESGDERLYVSNSSENASPWSALSRTQRGVGHVDPFQDSSAGSPLPSGSSSPKMDRPQLWLRTSNINNNISEGAEFDLPTPLKQHAGADPHTPVFSRGASGASGSGSFIPDRRMTIPPVRDSQPSNMLSPLFTIGSPLTRMQTARFTQSEGEYESTEHSPTAMSRTLQATSPHARIGRGSTAAEYRDPTPDSLEAAEDMIYGLISPVPEVLDDDSIDDDGNENVNKSSNLDRTAPSGFATPCNRSLHTDVDHSPDPFDPHVQGHATGFMTPDRSHASPSPTPRQRCAETPVRSTQRPGEEREPSLSFAARVATLSVETRLAASEILREGSLNASRCSRAAAATAPLKDYLEPNRNPFSRYRGKRGEQMMLAPAMGCCCYRCSCSSSSAPTPCDTCAGAGEKENEIDDLPLHAAIVLYEQTVPPPKRDTGTDRASRGSRSFFNSLSAMGPEQHNVKVGLFCELSSESTDGESGVFGSERKAVAHAEEANFLQACENGKDVGADQLHGLSFNISSIPVTDSNNSKKRGSAAGAFGGVETLPRNLSSLAGSSPAGQAGACHPSSSLNVSCNDPAAVSSIDKQLFATSSEDMNRSAQSGAEARSHQTPLHGDGSLAQWDVQRFSYLTESLVFDCNSSGCGEDEDEDEDSPGDRFRIHHGFQFLHRVPAVSEEPFFVPLGADVNGVVWLATHRLDGLPYAVKEISDVYFGQLKVELECLTLGSKPLSPITQQAQTFIAQYYGCTRYPRAILPRGGGLASSSVVTQCSHVYALQMEYFPKGSVWSWARSATRRKNGRPSFELWRQVLLSGVQALEALHHHGFVHGAPFTSNLFVVTHGLHYKLGNFGAAVACRSEGDGYPNAVLPFLRSAALAQRPFEQDVHVLCSSVLLSMCAEMMAKESFEDLFDSLVESPHLFDEKMQEVLLVPFAQDAVIAALTHRRRHPLTASKLRRILSSSTQNVELLSTCNMYDDEIQRLSRILADLKAARPPDSADSRSGETSIDYHSLLSKTSQGEDDETEDTILSSTGAAPPSNHRGSGPVLLPPKVPRSSPRPWVSRSGAGLVKPLPAFNAVSSRTRLVTIASPDETAEEIAAGPSMTPVVPMCDDSSRVDIWPAALRRAESLVQHALLQCSRTAADHAVENTDIHSALLGGIAEMLDIYFLSSVADYPMKRELTSDATPQIKSRFLQELRPLSSWE